jgi:mutator family transposase
VAAIIAMGVPSEIVGVGIGPSEAEPFWSAFLKGLVKRGLKGGRSRKRCAASPAQPQKRPASCSPCGVRDNGCVLQINGEQPLIGSLA